MELKVIVWKLVTIWDLMRQIDIALDCFPHNSGTTLNEHLYMGNPFITLSKRPGVGRIGASLLNAIGALNGLLKRMNMYIKLLI